MTLVLHKCNRLLFAENGVGLCGHLGKTQRDICFCFSYLNASDYVCTLPA